MPYKNADERRKHIREYRRKWLSNPENRERENKHRRQLQAQRRKHHQKECVICHKKFDTTNSLRKACSPECSKILKKNSRAKANIAFIQRNSNYRKEWYKQAKKEFVQLLGGKCQMCGYYKSIAALEFHHVNGADSPSSSELKNHKEFHQKINDGKITLLCANCHREAHYTLNGGRN